MLDGHTKEEAETYFAAVTSSFDLQNRGNDTGWTRNKFTGVATVAEDGSVTVKFDISALADVTNASAFTAHLSYLPYVVDEPADFKPNIEGFTGSAVTFNGKSFTVRYVKGSGEESDFWGCVGVDMTTAE